VDVAVLGSGPRRVGNGGLRHEVAELVTVHDDDALQRRELVHDLVDPFDELRHREQRRRI
jgi:hypothetical protein